MIEFTDIPLQSLVITITYNNTLNDSLGLAPLWSLSILLWTMTDFILESSRIELSRVESYVTTDGQSAILSLNKAPIWGLRPDFFYCQTVAGLLMWGSLSDERTDLSFTIAAGPRQRSHFRARAL
jgi:hypothetical protein